MRMFTKSLLESCSVLNIISVEIGNNGGDSSGLARIKHQYFLS